jgi:hypothetical protein
MATWRNLAIGVLHTAGVKNIAAGLCRSALAGPREEEAVHGGDLDPADLRAAVADTPSASLKRDVPPGKGLEPAAQLLL